MVMEYLISIIVTVPSLTILMIVEALSSVKVARVAAGRKHSVLCTAEGEVLTCGRGSGGKLGHGDTQDVFVPRVVMGLAGKAVVAVAASENHNLVLTADGDVFSFGEGAGLGHGGHGKQVCAVFLLNCSMECTHDLSRWSLSFSGVTTHGQGRLGRRESCRGRGRM